MTVAEKREKRIHSWKNMCLRKKKLKEKWADDIIERAETPLRKYFCNHCGFWHVTSKSLFK